ncbi:hypothetical protein ACHAC9_09165 [Massilia sp. CMS3.1]|uniref:hypothetical protein n=1 Tax=Massilia sp. CMS3.1 TaxID=3373083 RepID=UPI003EE70C5A
MRILLVQDFFRARIENQDSARPERPQLCGVRGFGTPQPGFFHDPVPLRRFRFRYCGDALFDCLNRRCVAGQQGQCQKK